MGISLIKQKSDKRSSSGQSEKKKMSQLVIKGILCENIFYPPPSKKKKKGGDFSPLGEGRCASVPVLLANRVSVDT